MKRGAVVVVALPGDTGKPRPAVVLRADQFAAHNRIAVVPLTSELHALPTLRVDLAPSPNNGLRIACQAMIDRLTNVAVGRIRQTIGQLVDADLQAIARAVAVYLGFAD